jgi:iron complex outermembrane recepter protein
MTYQNCYDNNKLQYLVKCKRLLITLAFIFSFMLIQAQNMITGKILNHDRLPLEGATVYISEINKGTYSNESGEYELQGLPNGRIRVQFFFLGYANHIEIIELKNENAIVNVILKPTIVEADEVVVSGIYNSTQHNNAVKIDVLKIDPHKIMITPNFAEALTQVPGVDMISKGSGVAKPVIRGLSMSDILILNNGVRFESYQYSEHHPLGIDEFGIEDVEVIKGPASLLYGSDAIGGVINFIKEKPAPLGNLQGDYNLQLFSNSLGLTNSLGLKGSKNNFHGGMRFGNKTNADYLQGGGGDFVPNTRFMGTSLGMNTGYSNSNMALNIFYDYSLHKIGLAEEDAISYINEHGRGRNPEVYYMLLKNHLLASRNKFFLNRFRLEVNSAYQKYGLQHSEGPGEIAIEMSLQTVTYESRLYFPSDNKSEYIIGFQGLNQLNSNLNDRETKLLPDANTNNYSLFGLFQYTFFNKLKIQTGTRYDWKSILTQPLGLPSDPDYRPSLNKKYGSLSGSLGSTFNYSENLLFRMNLAAAYRTPNLSELTSNGQHELRYEIGDQNLKPENSWETDLSIHYHIENFTFEVAGFYNSIGDYIFLAPTGEITSSGFSIYKFGQSNSFLYGGEADLHIHPKNIEWLHFQTNYSSVVGKQKSGGYLPFIPAHKLRFELRGEIGKLLFLQNPFISLFTTTALAQDNTAPEEISTSGYTILDLSIGSKIKVKDQDLLIRLSANNLFDKKYYDHLSTLKEVGYYNSGRNIVLSLNIPFSILSNQTKDNF